MTGVEFDQTGYFSFPVLSSTSVSVGDINDDAADPIVVFWIGDVRMLGSLSVLIDRFEAAIAVLERARDHPQLRELLLPRRRRRGLDGSRTWLQPFRDPPGQFPVSGRETPSTTTTTTTNGGQS
jgi:hypothetical protein